MSHSDKLKSALRSAGAAMVLCGSLSLLAPGSSQAQEEQQLDAQGNVIDRAAAERAAEAAAAAPSATLACFKFVQSSTNVWSIETTLDPTVYPYRIVAGSISGAICDSPNWQVTGGSVGSNLTVEGRYTGSASCASQVSIVGNSVPPAGYNGTYGFNGSNSTWSHQTLFLGYDSCP